MTARTVAAATFFAAIAGASAAHAADPQLVSLVMPDAKILAGVNVDSAKGSPFGQWVVSQIGLNNTGLQQFIALTGFDPTRDLSELLVANNGTTGGNGPSGLALARGVFNPATMTAAASGKGALTELYGTVTIVEDPQKQAGLAFLGQTLAIAGDLADVKAAIDRQTSPQPLPAAVAAQVTQWSGSEDAWFLSTVPPSSLASLSSGSPAAGILQQIQQAAGGVKFGDSVVGTLALQSDNPQDATQLATSLQFLVNLAQMQSQNNPQAANLVQAIAVSAQGSTVTISETLPQAQFQQLLQSQKKAMVAAPRVKK